MNYPFLEMTLDGLRAAMAELGRKPFRAEQLADWVYRKGVTDPAEMSNLPADAADGFDILTSRVVRRTDSPDGVTKLLLELSDGEHVETALIPARGRATACLSTQVGCGMGCSFCATARDGLRRNMSASEILQQVLHLRQATGRAVTNAVFMGMGEPLANYDATVAAVRALIDPQRFALSARRVTVSTIGLPGKIRRLAKEGLPITLAISLHAPNDALRRQLIPAAKATSIEDIVSAAQTFFRSRKREVTLEYVLLRGVNDTGLCAEGLARIAKGLRCNVNVIPYNPSESDVYERPSKAATEDFAARLKRQGVNVHVRRSRGLDAEAACGQLRARTADENAS
ncbi:MAG: 23S rRNA (adenine(2503)-C(2))-methyltransferase RlmN [Phycisphaerae bacterium]